MNQIFKFSLLLSGMITAIIDCYGQIQPASSDAPSKLKLERKSTPIKRRAPSNIFLECEYTLNGIYLYQSYLYESAELTVESNTNSDSWSATLSDENGYFLETGELHGTYCITATTDNGIVYYGEITVN